MPFPNPIQKSTSINAPASKVWAVLTKAELIKEWLSEVGITVSTDWKIGSSIIYSGNWHGIEYKDKGTVLKYEPEKVLQYNNWSCLSQLPDEPENYSVMEFQLVENDSQTQLMLLYSNFATEVMYLHYNFYWEATLGIIKKMAEVLPP